MPELPEVETVRRICRPFFINKPLLSVRLNRADLRFPLPSDLATLPEGSVFTNIRRHGKYLLFDITADGRKVVLLWHLGMTGRFVLRPARKESDVNPNFYHNKALNAAHEHIIFEFEGGDSVSFYDPRRFGFVDYFIAGAENDNIYLKKLGPDALKPAEVREALLKAREKKSAPVKHILLDQSVIAGVGNIYASEILWRVGVHPLVSMKTLSVETVKDLSAATNDVLNAALGAGGSTLKDFKHPDGASGGYASDFSVYDRAGENCKKPGCQGRVSKLVTAGRATFFCEKCQPAF